jgi:hypothetical protein
MPQLAEEVPRPLLHAQQLGNLPDDDGQGQADDESLQDGLGDEIRDEPQSQQPSRQREHAGGESERDRQGGGCAGIACRDIPDRGSRQHGGGRRRADHQVTGTTGRRIQHQRARHRIQADHRRYPGDRGVGQRLRYQHRPDRQPGDPVPTQPPAPVPPQRCERRNRGPPRRSLPVHHLPAEREGLVGLDKPRAVGDGQGPGDRGRPGSAARLAARPEQGSPAHLRSPTAPPRCPEPTAQRPSASRGDAGRRRVGYVADESAKMVPQSFRILTIVQPSARARSSDLSAPAV